MAATPNGSHSYPKRVVLCVDDEAQILQVLHEFMTASGYSVLTARTPESALELFRNNHVDAVITDYEIGAATGETVIRSLRALKPRVPVLVFSGADDLPQPLLALADRCVNKTEIRVLAFELATLLEFPRPTARPR